MNPENRSRLAYVNQMLRSIKLDFEVPIQSVENVVEDQFGFDFVCVFDVGKNCV